MAGAIPVNLTAGCGPTNSLVAETRVVFFEVSKYILSRFLGSYLKLSVRKAPPRESRILKPAWSFESYIVRLPRTRRVEFYGIFGDI